MPRTYDVGFIAKTLKMDRDVAAGTEWREISLAAEWSPALVQHVEQRVIPHYLKGARWFGGKRRALLTVRFIEELQPSLAGARFFVLEATYEDGEPERYFLPLAIHRPLPNAALEGAPRSIVARFASGALLVDAHALPEFRRELVSILAGEAPPGSKVIGRGYEDLATGQLEPTRLKEVEQSNTSIAVGGQFWLKLYRKCEVGVHPEVEMMEHLRNAAGFTETPSYAGALFWRSAHGECAMGVMMEHTRHQGDGWIFTLEALDKYLARVLEHREPSGSKDLAKSLIGESYPRRAGQLGVLTAKLHLTLAAAGEGNAAFAPELLGQADKQALHAGMRVSAERVLVSLHTGLGQLPSHLQEEARTLCGSLNAIHQVYARLLQAGDWGYKIRTHGDLHLAQVLNTGDGFVFIDFEGEPTASLEERRLERPALRDVASMLRSFDYAAATAVLKHPAADRAYLEPWARAWVNTVCDQFLEAYFATCQGVFFLPTSENDRQTLLQCLLLEKAIYELGYELNYRPSWAGIPLQAALRLLGIAGAE